MIIKMLKKIRDLIKPPEKTGNEGQNITTKAPLSNISNSNISRFNFKQLIKTVNDYFIYLIRYKVGYVMPKRGRPQTVVVIARKRK